MSDKILSMEDMVGSTVIYENGGETLEETMTSETVMDAASIFGVSGAVALTGGGFPAVISLNEAVTQDGLTVSAGTFIGIV